MATKNTRRHEKLVGFGAGLSAISLAMCVLAATAFASGGGAGHTSDMTHRMMLLVIQLGVILLAARLGNMLLERLKMPGVLGELLAGMLIGPYLLGAVPLPGFENGLFPVGTGFAVSAELYGLCSVAAVVLLFMVGLETDTRLLKRYWVAGCMVGVGGVVVSFLAGDLTGMLFSSSLYGRRLGFFSPPCVLLGIVATATSVGITARILSEKRKLASPEGVTILAGAVVDDVLGMILLAVGLSIIAASAASGGINWGHIGIIAAKAIGIWLAATVAGLLASRRISLLLKLFKDRSAIAVMALGLALILAGLFEEAGLAMIIGAYIMGLSLSRTDLTYVIREKLDPIYAFLVPVFFAVMGMLVDLRLLLSMDVIVFGMVYTVFAGVAKIVGSGLPALLCRFNVRGALRIGCGMLPRGEVTLIIAGIGLAAGVLSPEVFGAVVFMLIATTVIAPPVLARLFTGTESGLLNPEPDQSAETISFSFPSTEAAELLVGKLLRAFESEGFFVHLVDRNNRVYQLRKDVVAICLRLKGQEISFECDRRQKPFINTAMYEVLAELEHTVAELKKPVDTDKIGRHLQDSAGPGELGGALAQSLSTKTLVPRLEGTTKIEVIDELLAALDRTGGIRDVSAARSAVLAREESMSTGMQYGIAIPHGRTDEVTRLVCAVGIKHEGVDFDSIDGQPSRIIVLTLAPVSKAAPHMQFMSMIGQVLNERGRTTLLACTTADEMYSVLIGRSSGRSKATVRRLRSMLGRKKHSALANYVRPDLVNPELKGTAKTEIVDELLQMLAAAGLVSDTDAVRSDVMAREDEMPTVVGHGVAIPHARTDHVEGLVCAVGIHHEGVDFNGPKSEKTKIVVLTLSPKTGSAPHIQFMAMISRALDESGRRRALAAKTRAELWEALVG